MNGNGRRPAITLVTLCGCHAMANLVQSWHKNHGRMGPLFHLSHTGLARNRRVSGRTNHPSAHSLGCKGRNDNLPWGGNAETSSASSVGCFVSSASSSTCLSLRSCNQLYRLCNEKRLFLGMPGIATNAFPWQESVPLTVRPAPGEKLNTTFCHSKQWPCGHSFDGTKPL